MILLLLLFKLVLSHRHDSFYTYKSDFDTKYKKIFTHMIHYSDVNNDTNIFTLDYLGTHDSAAYNYGFEFVDTQALSIYEQLEYGVRFLDIRLRHVQDAFAVHHSFVFLGMMFGDILNEVRTFLRNYPDEFVVLALQKDAESLEPIGTLCEVLYKYIDKWGKDNFFLFKSDNDKQVTIKDVRGKMAIVGQAYFDYCPGTFSFNYCAKQMEWDLAHNWQLYHKWTLVKDFAIKYKNTTSAKRACGINFLGGSSSKLMVRPAFVVGGHIFSFTNSYRLSTGLTTPIFDSYYPDFPRTTCFLGICTISFEGTNVLHDDMLGNMKTEGYGSYILITDYFGINQPINILKNNLKRKNVQRDTNHKICVEHCNLDKSCTYSLISYAPLSLNYIENRTDFSPLSDLELIQNSNYKTRNNIIKYNYSGNCVYKYKVKHCTNNITCINDNCETTYDTSKIIINKIKKCPTKFNKKFFTTDTGYLPTYTVPEFLKKSEYKYKKDETPSYIKHDIIQRDNRLYNSIFHSELQKYC